MDKRNAPFHRYLQTLVYLYRAKEGARNARCGQRTRKHEDKEGWTAWLGDRGKCGNFATFPWRDYSRCNSYRFSRAQPAQTLRRKEADCTLLFSAGMDASLVEYKIETWPTSIVGSVDRARGDEMVEGTLPDKERKKKKRKKSGEESVVMTTLRRIA